MSKKITMIVGSFRNGSFNQSFANYIADSFKKEGAEVEFLNYRNLPLLEQDTEFPTPAEVTSIREQVAKADALFIVSPEYNGSYPAVLKNLLDWLSRPAKAFDFETPTVINGKPVTVAAAAGSTVGKFVRANLLTLTSYIRMNTMPGEGLGITLPAEAWQTGVLELSEDQKTTVDNYVKEFLNFVA